MSLSQAWLRLGPLHQSFNQVSSPVCRDNVAEKRLTRSIWVWPWGQGTYKEPAQTLPHSAHLPPQDPSPWMVPIALPMWKMPYISGVHALKHTELRQCNSHTGRHSHKHTSSEYTMTELGINSHTCIYNKICRDSLVYTLSS